MDVVGRLAELGHPAGAHDVARAGAGAVATQSWANTSFGPRGLELMASGLSAEETIRRLSGEDDGREQRQVGMVDLTGSPATFTGSECMEWAGGRTGGAYACQGNILVGPEVVEAFVAMLNEEAAVRSVSASP